MMRQVLKDDRGSLPFAMLVAMVTILTSAMLGTTLAWQARSADREQAIQDARWAADSAVSVAMDRMSSTNRLLRGVPVADRAPTSSAQGPAWRTTASEKTQMRWFVIPGTSSNNVMLIAEGRTTDRVPLVYTTVIDMSYNFGSGRWTATRVSSDFKEETGDSITPRAAPGPPQDVVATPSSGTISLTWTAPVSDGGAAIGDYIVQYRTSSDSEWKTLNDSVSTLSAATISGLVNGTTYDVQVLAVNSLGASQPSQPVSVIVG